MTFQLTEADLNILTGGIELPPQPQPPPRKLKASVPVLAIEVNRLAGRIAQLEMEAIRLAKPLPKAESFHASDKPIRILTGANQATKTFHGILELSRALLGKDPYGKYPKRDGRAIVVGYDQDHLTDPIFRKMFLPGEFKLIRDEHTGKFRAVRPDPNNPTRLDPYDLAYSEKWIDAPPFIPPHQVKHAWENFAQQIPRISTILPTGWKLLWRSSNSRPPRGRQINIALLDEDLHSPGPWINEMIPRLLKHHGKLIWLATAQEGGPEMYELCEKAKTGSSYIEVIRLLLTDNPYIDENARAFMLDTLTTEEDIQVRFYGENAITTRLIYRHYEPNGVHGCEPFPVPTNEWCRIIGVDPGRKHCGTVFVAIDPEEKHRWLYDAFDLQQGDAHSWAAQIAARQGDMRFEAIVMDRDMGKETPTASCRSVAQQYWSALVQAGVKPRRQGPLAGFFPGSNQPAAREEGLLSWMMVRGSGPYAGLPLLQVMKGICPELDRQIKLAQMDPNNPEKRRKMRQDLLVALEYVAHMDPQYHEPQSAEHEMQLGKPKTVSERLQEKRQRIRARQRAMGHARPFITAP